MPDLDAALTKLTNGYSRWWEARQKTIVFTHLDGCLARVKEAVKKLNLFNASGGSDGPSCVGEADTQVIDTESFFEMCESDSRQKRREVRDRPKQPLFHYTDGAGLKGIVADQKLRLTDISHLNDHKELNHGFELARERLRHHERSGGPVELFCRVTSDAIQQRFSDRFGIFVASLSAAKDDLGQWRAYAMNGHGYSIGFSSRLFRISATRPTNDNEVYWIAKVVYDERDARRYQHLAVDRAVRIVSHAFANRLVPDRVKTRFLHEMSVNLSVPILWNALTTKHVAYEAERETRLIMVNSVQRLAPFVETHVRNGEVVPFVALPIPMRRRGSLTNLIVGPASSSDSLNGARQFLRSVGLETSVHLERSSIPYRTP